MGKTFVILFFLCFGISLSIIAQNQDTIKYSFLPIEQITAYYDRINASIVVNALPENTKFTAELYDITGLSIIKSELNSLNRRIEIPVVLKQGVYILIVGTKNYSVTRKFRVN